MNGLLMKSLVLRYADAEERISRFAKDLEEKQERLAQDLRSAAAIQTALLPQPVDRPGVRVAAGKRSASRCRSAASLSGAADMDGAVVEGQGSLAELMQLIGSDRGDLAAPFSLRQPLHRPSGHASGFLD